MQRSIDGSAGDADDSVIGHDDARYRQPDPHFVAAIDTALGNARTLIDVGPGAGSYESTTLTVTAVEPSAAMRAPRPTSLAPAVDATAEALPHPDDSLDAGLDSFTVHQWSDLQAGLQELRRVVRGPVLVLTCDAVALDRSWLNACAPEVIQTEADRYPDIGTIASGLGTVTVDHVPILLQCTDRFSEAYYGRPEGLLDPGARRADSAWSSVDPAVTTRVEQHLRRDLDSGMWDARHGHPRTKHPFDGSLRLIISRP